MSEPRREDPGGIPAGTFRIDREGTWRHEGQEVTHAGVLRNLYANLRVEDDTHFLQVGSRRVPVAVEDAPFVVGRVELAGEHSGTLRIHLSDGTEEPLAPDSVWIGGRDTPYCRVKSGRFRARFSVPAWLQLARFVEEEPGTGELRLVIGGGRLPLARRP